MNMNYAKTGIIIGNILEIYDHMSTFIKGYRLVSESYFAVKSRL